MSVAFSIDIDYDMRDKIMAQIIVEDHNHLCQDIEKYLAKDELKPYEKEDFQHWVAVRDALFVLSHWYMVEHDRKKLSKHADRMEINDKLRSAR